MRSPTKSGARFVGTCSKRSPPLHRSEDRYKLLHAATIGNEHGGFLVIDQCGVGKFAMRPEPRRAERMLAMVRRTPSAAGSHCADQANPGGPEVASAWLWLSIILAVGLALRVFLIGHESIWLDEAISWQFAHISQHELWTEVLDTHPPLYYSMLRLWLVFGDSEAALRSLSVVFGMLAILLTYVLGRQIADARVGLFAAALMATSALQLEYSQEARSYELLTAASLAASIGLVGILQAHEARRRPRIAICVLYVVGMVIALYAHNIALLLFGVAGLVGLADAIRRGTLGSTAVWVALNVLVVAGWCYWLPVVWQQSTGEMPRLSWLKPPNLQAVIEGARNLYGQGYVYAWQPVINLIGAPLAIAGAFLHRRAGFPIAYLLAAAFGIPLLEIIISHLGRPVYMTRTVIWVAPLFFILVAMAFARVRLSHAVLATGLMIAIQLVGVKNYEQLPKKEPWRQTAQSVAEQACPGDVMLLAPYSLSEAPFEYYFERRPISARVLAGYVGKLRVPDRRIHPFEFTDIGHPDETLLSAPRVWIFLADSFTPNATLFITRLSSQHALGESIAMQQTTVELFEVPGTSCSRQSEKQAASTPGEP
jgi:mannosyltransferase